MLERARENLPAADLRRARLEDPLPEGPFDLVVSALAIHHLDAVGKRDLFHRIAAVLRPGGWLLVEDMDVYPLQTLAEGLFLEVVNAMVRAFEAAGASGTFGRQLPELFDRAGLEAVESLCEVPVSRGGGPFARLISASLAQLRPLIVAQGVTEEQLVELDRQLADPTWWFSAFALYSVRGRAPAA
jgi:SAM-dependent methyltransferase